MKLHNDLNSVLRPTKPEYSNENTIDKIKNSPHGKLNYQRNINVKTPEKDLELNDQNLCLIKKDKSLNSFQLNKICIEEPLIEKEINIKENKNLIKKEELDQLVAEKSTFNVEKKLKELSENDCKTLQEKHKHHVQLFDKFRTSPKLLKESSIELNRCEKIIKSPEESQVKVSENKQTSLTQKEIEYKIQNDKSTKELFEYEKQAIQILTTFEVLLNELNAIDKINDDVLKKLCLNRINEKQSMINNKIIDKLKLYLRINPQSYDSEVRNFIDEFKKSEIIYKNEINETEMKIKNYLKSIEAANQIKIEKHQKALELFLNEKENYEKKFKHITEIYKSLIQKAENTDKNRDKIDESFYKDINNSLKSLENFLNMNLKELTSDKIQKQNETEYQKCIDTFKKIYEQSCKNVKECEVKLNEELLRIQKPPESVVNSLKVQPTVTQTTGLKKIGIMQHALLIYDESIEYLKKTNQEFDKIFNTTELKSYQFELQKAINFPLNSLLDDDTSNDLKTHFHDKIKTFLRLLNGETCVITSALTVNPTKHPKAIQYLMDYLAKKIIEKGEKTVSSRPDTAFQYVQLAITIKKYHPNFEKSLIAYFYYKCPYTVPYFKSKLADQSIEDYFESMGYKVDDGKVEEDEYFYKRMSGILYLYFTLLIHQEYKNGLQKAWKWLSDILNMKPRANITAHALVIFFKCCGFQLQLAYQNQFKKIVYLCINQYLPHIKAFKPESQDPAFLGRLELILSNYIKNGYFDEWKK